MPALKEIEKQAMHLERTDRALLAAHLIASIDPGEDIDAAELWVKEAERRYAAFRKGEIASAPADEALERARQQL
jgi:hypothetical protein